MSKSLTDWISAAPLWQIGLSILIAMAIASALGIALRRRRTDPGDKSADSEEGSGDQGIVVSAVIGLLALLIAFTFAMSIDRFDTRRGNVLNEANAIGTTYLRAQLLEPPHRQRLSALLIEYTNVRIELAKAAPGPGQTRLLSANDRLITDLWKATVAAFPTLRPFDLSHSFLETMNNLIDMDATRKAGRQAHVPPVIFLALLLYQSTSAGLISYVIGRRARIPAAILFLLLAALLLLIIDVDRPRSGGVRESQEPMLQLQAFMKAQPPGSFHAEETLPPLSR